MCEDCRRERDIEINRIRYNKRGMFRTDNRSVKIVYDPLPIIDGGFRTGAEITRTDLYYGMISGCFVEGTIFNVGNQQKIVERVKGKLKLIHR